MGFRDNIIKEAEWIEEHIHEIVYTWKDDTGAGYAFPCDHQGNIDRSSMNSAALANLEFCETDGGKELYGPFHETRTHRWREHAIMRCSCGAEVVLAMSLTNPCGCGREYNASGQLLAPRCQWGWDTGETEAEIMAGNELLGGDY